MKSLKVLSVGVVLTAGLLLSSLVWADDYAIDKIHSTVGFSVKHMMVSKTNGVFKDYDGTIKCR